MIEEKKFFKYATYDEDGFINGVRDDAPDEIKKEYAEFVKEQEEARINGIKI